MTGKALLHEPGALWDAWDDVPLTGRRVAFDKWASRKVRFVVDGQRIELELIDEESILAVFTEGE